MSEKSYRSIAFAVAVQLFLSFYHTLILLTFTVFYLFLSAPKAAAGGLVTSRISAHPSYVVEVSNAWRSGDLLLLFFRCMTADQEALVVRRNDTGCLMSIIRYCEYTKFYCHILSFYLSLSSLIYYGISFSFTVGVWYESRDSLPADPISDGG